jgi:DNA-binding HxlR family transcriptional regulator
MPSSYPQPLNVTPQGQQILDVIREMGDWIGRAEIARRVEKTKLNKWDVGMLKKLENDGLIEARKIPFHGAIGYEWEYRAIQPSAE